MDSATRNFLRKRGHALKPVVMIGRSGFDERIVEALDVALNSHELVKVRFQTFFDEKRTISEELALKVEGEVVTVIGHIALIFRQNRDPAKRVIHLPSHLGGRV
ncbi:MAG: YhbY family RNA-binding protein [Sphaerochaetaceae bacterium]|jgi:RNA-binding protein|nr:YhbY family RNA-binding protein [Sphaerochaetaceae bacterium]HHU89327.1 YhbY family RNA-binding protein [Spirochaetales bacterium]